MASEVNSGLEGIVAAETTISLVDGQAGRLLYRGYEIGDLAAHGSYDRVVALLLDGEWPARDQSLPVIPPSPAVIGALRSLPPSSAPLDALRTGVSAFGAERPAGGTPARRRAVGGARPAHADRRRRPRRAVDPRRAGARRAADGLRPPRLQDDGPARGRAAPGG